MERTVEEDTLHWELLRSINELLACDHHGWCLCQQRFETAHAAAGERAAHIVGECLRGRIK